MNWPIKVGRPTEWWDQATCATTKWVKNQPALQDGVRLQAIKAKYVYDALLKWYTKGVTPCHARKRQKNRRIKILKNAM